MAGENEFTEVKMDDLLLVVFMYMAKRGMLDDLIEKYGSGEEKT